jgi:hypothetical protein
MRKSKMEEKIVVRNVIELWANQYSDVTRWLTFLQRKKQAAYHFYRFCKWAQKTPPELLALKEKDSSVSPPPNIVEKLLDDFCGRDISGFTNAQKYNSAISVKSFFKHSYRDLAKASGVVTLEKVKPYNKLSKEILRRLWNRALNPRDRALIPFTTSTGIAKETLSMLTWGHLEENWETKDLPCINIGSELLKGHGHGKYKGVRQITFLTPEAKRELINYKEWIEEKLGRKLTPQDHIWRQTCKPYEPVTYEAFGNIITVLSNNAGVDFSWHDARRWVNTALEQIGISPNWARKIRGRKVKGEESPYSQPNIEQLRAKFREAVPLLEFTYEDTGLEQRVQRQEAITEIQSKLVSGEPLTEGDRDKIKRFNIQVRSKSTATRKQHEKECEDGTHCQQIVSEENLARYLSEGWKVVATLPSGKIVVDR